MSGPPKTRIARGVRPKKTVTISGHGVKSPGGSCADLLQNEKTLFLAPVSRAGLRRHSAGSLLEDMLRTWLCGSVRKRKSVRSKPVAGIGCRVSGGHVSRTWVCVVRLAVIDLRLRDWDRGIVLRSVRELATKILPPTMCNTAEA
jgi:hypothetical protein